MQAVEISIAYFICVNLVAWFLFGHDKDRAMTGGWRTPESILLATALFGGGIGAKVGQRQYRHKTRKEPFRTRLNIFTVLGLIAFAALNVPATRSAILSAVIDQLPGGAADDTTRNPRPRVIVPGGGSTF